MPPASLPPAQPLGAEGGSSGLWGLLPELQPKKQGSSFAKQRRKSSFTRSLSDHPVGRDPQAMRTGQRQNKGMRTRLGCLSHKSDSCSDFTAILPDKPNRALKRLSTEEATRWADSFDVLLSHKCLSFPTCKAATGRVPSPECSQGPGSLGIGNQQAPSDLTWSGTASGRVGRECSPRPVTLLRACLLLLRCEGPSGKSSFLSLNTSPTPRWLFPLSTGACF
ncbi:PREDICTED: regulator of G-protein signaling 8 isoform X4 [Myotis brandtii]|uniref:regulator of G-protein signaling 8 isoform X4 n=1 Tax=Myotis brandtii TaxID=109478 RepID=UPI000704352D|nr:PREDICTED: regulator of G-protein signaling 8 isoform X4 [Myotis brandtii]